MNAGKTCLTTMVVALLVSGAACNRNNKAEQLAELNSAYQSGVLTKGEYEAKKAALLGAEKPATKSAPPTALPSATAPPAPIVSPPAIQAPPSTAVRSSIALPSVPPKRTTPASSPPVIPKHSEQEEHQPTPAAGCEDQEYRSGDKTQERFFPVPAARVKQAARTALKTLDFKIHIDSDDEIEASKKRQVTGVLKGSGGEKITLHFEAAQQGNQRGTRVAVETKKNLVLGVRQKSWTSAVLAETACVLRKGGSPQ